MNRYVLALNFSIGMKADKRNPTKGFYESTRDDSRSLRGKKI